MRVDWRRRILQLPSVGEVTAQAVRAAYWRQVGETVGADKERLMDAKRELLFELGVRIPPSRKAQPNANGASDEPALRPSASTPQSRGHETLD